MSAPSDDHHLQDQPAGSSQMSPESLPEASIPSTTNHSEALSTEDNMNARPANASVQSPSPTQTRQKRQRSDEDIPPMPLKRQKPDEDVPPMPLPTKSIHRQSAAPQSSRTLTTAATSPRESAIPPDTLAAGTAQLQQAGQIPTGPQTPHTPNNLQSQVGVVTQSTDVPPEVQAWRDAGKPRCGNCDKVHAPPCIPAKVVEAWRDAGRPRCKNCGKAHAPPCIPAKVAEANARAAQQPQKKRQTPNQTPAAKNVVNLHGGQQGTDASPALPASSATSAALPAQPNAPSATVPGMNIGNNRSDTWRQQVPQMFARLVPADRLRFLAAMHQNTVGQLTPGMDFGNVPQNQWTDETLAMFAELVPNDRLRFLSALYEGTMDQLLRSTAPYTNAPGSGDWDPSGGNWASWE